ncbi:MAG: MBL fold metallo-hydrolase [Candidatus Binataceae bacterium]
METRVDEIAPDIYRLSTLVPGVAGPAGLSFNQFLINADQPLLFHTGPRRLFPLVSAAIARIIDPSRLRWINFSHVEADECGALENWLAVAPQATPAHGRVGCSIWLNDMIERPSRALADDEIIDLGGKRVRHLDTPHLPHCWDAGLLYEETTRTLFCSDLFTQTGDCPALTDKDIVEPALAIEKMLPFSSIPPNAAPMVRRLAALSPEVLAIMHGSSFRANVPAALEALAAYYESRAR